MTFILAMWWRSLYVSGQLLTRLSVIQNVATCRFSEAGIGAVLDSLWWTEKVWGISGQKINIFPTSSPRVVNRFPIPTISLHFPQQLSHKLSINQHFPFMFPTPKSTFYPQINILSMPSCTKTLETSKLGKEYQHSLNINPTQLSASHLVFGIFATSSI